jgi:uncharacterized protein (TIGR00299 family) protein
MSTVLFLDPVGGVAGDMFLGAAVDLGVSVKALEESLQGLRLPGWRLVATKADRHAIAGTHVRVEVEGHSQGHSHRPLSDILGRISVCASLSPMARERAAQVFRLLGEAEAKIHGVPVEQVEFHEVGAVDSIVDVCGAAAALDVLGNPRLFCGPPPLGSGVTQSVHGTLPVPAPATLEVLRGFPVRFEGTGELTTPTGAALIRAWAEPGRPPNLTVDRVGYGVGTRTFPDRPNVLRAVLGHLTDSTNTGVWVLEANLDDATPQLLGALLESLMAEGALDAYILPATMKKGRPGHLLGVLASDERRERLVELVLQESTTLGVRFHRTERIMLERRHTEVDTRYGKLRVKLGMSGSKVLNALPEFEDCRARAAEHKVPVKEVWAEALAAARSLR